MRTIRYLPESVRVAGRTYTPGLVDIECYPELLPYVDSREVEVRKSDGAWRYAARG